MTAWISVCCGVAHPLSVDATDGIVGILSLRSRQCSVVESCGSAAALREHARKITVKVLTGGQWSSGILIRNHEQTYAVLTNEHVLRTGDSYQVQTVDGEVYAATASGGFAENDLAVLRFRSDRRYEIATLGSSLSLPVGTPVFAAGFPVPGLANPGFTFTTGHISLVSPKVLEGGYQLGYTNLIEKGMSGGPVLNLRGDVIAINGTHQEPLWGDPYRFVDGTRPPLQMRPLLLRSSWAIPMETFRRFADRLSLL
ncbi:MAG: serine protease [Thermosynechococcaceae cyanobacterium]